MHSLKKRIIIMSNISIEHNLNKARSLTRKGKNKEALSLYKSMIKKFPNNKRIQFAVQQLKPPQERINTLLQCYQSKEFILAENLATSLTQDFPAHGFGWKALGLILAESGRNNEALTIYQKAIITAPQDAEIYSNFGNLLRNLNRLDESESNLRKAVFLKPDHADFYNNLAITLQKLGKLEEAENCLLQAIKLKQDFIQAYNNLGFTLNELGKYHEAEIILTKLITIKPDFAIAYNNLGNTLQGLDKFDKSEVMFRRAIKLKSDYFEAYNNLGVTFQKMEKYLESEEMFIQAIKIKPNYAQALYNLGNTYRELGRFGESEVNLKKSINFKSDFTVAHYNLAMTLLKMGRIDDSIEELNKAININPDYLSAKHQLAALRGEITSSAPLEYVEGLFDGFAMKFENSLVNKLNYKIPKIITNIILRKNKSERLGSVIDLGCGTGLLGDEIKDYCKILDGVDISEKMLEVAKKKNIYDDLIKEDIVRYLSNINFSYDYFILTDVFVYIGDLSEVFNLIKTRNDKEGKLVFSTEDYNGDSFVLQKTGRYAHSKKYIEKLCEKFQYKIDHFEFQPLRKENREFIQGGIYLLKF